MNPIVEKLLSDNIKDVSFIIKEVSEEDAITFLEHVSSIKEYPDTIKYLFNKPDKVKLLILQKAKTLSEDEISFKIEMWMDYQITKGKKLNKNIKPKFKAPKIVEKYFPGLYIIFEKDDHEISRKWNLLAEDRNLIHQIKEPSLREYAKEKLEIALNEVIKYIEDKQGDYLENAYEFLRQYKNGLLNNKIKKLVSQSIFREFDEKAAISKSGKQNKVDSQTENMKNNRDFKNVEIKTNQSSNLQDVLVKLNNFAENSDSFLDDITKENPLNVFIYLSMRKEPITYSEINKIFSVCKDFPTEQKQLVIYILTEKFNSLEHFDGLFQALMKDLQWYNVWESGNKINTITNICSVNENLNTILTFLNERSLMEQDAQEVVYSKIYAQYQRVPLQAILTELYQGFSELIFGYLRFVYNQKSDYEQNQMIKEVINILLDDDIDLHKILGDVYQNDDFTYNVLVELSKFSTMRMKQEKQMKLNTLQKLEQQELNIRIELVKSLRDFTERFESRLSDYKKGIDVPKEKIINELFAFHAEYREGLKRIGVFPLIDDLPLGELKNFNPQIQKSSNFEIRKDQECIISTLGMQIIQNEKKHILCKSLVDPKEKE